MGRKTATSDNRPKSSPARQKRSLRTLWLEILFFIALAVFGFSVVSTLTRGGRGLIVQFAPIFPVPPSANKPHLYEASSVRPLPAPSLSPIFMPGVQYWKEQILQWGTTYNLDPNLIATVMQIESCGNPQAQSGAGASGLFQVMPFHFSATDQPFDPDTNAQRGIAYLAKGLQLAGGHAGLALAGYNGGNSIISRKYELWPVETQRYYRWGSGIYREASAGWDSSPTLAAWLAAGGQSLCDKAAAVLNLPQTTPTP